MKITTKELDFLKKAVIIQWNAWKKDCLLVTYKLIEKVPNFRNAKEHYQPLIRKKSRKSVKQSKIITYQPKSYENLNNVDVKSVIVNTWKLQNFGASKNSPKLSKTIKKGENVGSNSSLYSDTKNWKIFDWKECKNNKTRTCF